MAEEQEKKPDDDKAKDGPEEEIGKGKRKRLLVFGGLGLFAVIIIGGGAAFFIGGFGPNDSGSVVISDDEDNDINGDFAKDPDEITNEMGPGEESTARGEVTLTDFGETYQLRTFNLNLGNPLENSYIRVEVALEYRGGEAQREEIERRMPQLRDAIVSVIGRKSREFLLGPDGIAQLRRELQIRINRYMSQPIEAVYITDLLIE